MKKNHVPKKESSLLEMKIRHGIQRTRDQKCGNYITLQIKKGESIRVFPISNWTETDIWKYIKREKIDIVPLYFAKERPVIERDGNIIMVDDDRLKLKTR